MKNNIIKIVIALAIFLPGLVFAANLSYVPRVYLDGYAGNDSNLLGKADILAPIFLRADKNLFAYAQGKYAYEDKSWQDNTYTGSFGLGFRQIVKDTTVLGAYVFGDYSSSTSGHNFWIVSPGIESLTRNWDFRANGYFPVGDTRWIDQGWASEFGDYHYIEFTKNQQWDHWYQYYQETGIGGDAEVGRNLFMLKGMFKGILFKGFINGYYYNMKHNDDVMGGGARLNIQPNRSLKISLRYSYDNYEHSTFMAGVQLSFYDLIGANRNNPIDIQDLQRNLFVPIERNLGTIGSGSSIPVTRSDTPEDVGQRLEYDNVWFFDPNPAPAANSEGSGTAEDPFRVFTIDTYNKIDPSVGKDAPRLYFAANHIFNLGSFEQYRFQLPAGWTMQGWFMTAGEKQNNRPATGNDRPLFEGGFKLNNACSINNLRLGNITDANASLDVGIVLSDVTSAVINNVTVGTDNPANPEGILPYDVGMGLDKASVTIQNASQIFGYSVDDVAAGITATNEDTATITATSGSLIEGKSVNNSGIGIDLLPSALGDIKLGAITGDGTALFKGIGTDAGLYVGGCGLCARVGISNVNITTISGSTFTGEGKAGDGYYSVGGCGLYAFAVNVNINEINDSAFTGDDSAGDGYYSVGGCGLYAFASDDLKIGTIGGSTFTGNGEAGDGDNSVGGCGLYASSVNRDINITTINGSTFTGDGEAGSGLNSVGGCGLYVFADVRNVDIDEINGSTFTGNYTTGTVSSHIGGCGLYAHASNVDIDKISGSTFTGNYTTGTVSSYIGGCGLYADASNVDVDEISGSTFVGNDEAGTVSSYIGGCGLYANTFLGSVDINTINGSTFTGNGNGIHIGGCGLYAKANYNNVYITEIDGSTFTGNGTAGGGGDSAGGCGLYARATTNFGIVTLGATAGSIVDNDFRGSTDVGIWLLGGTPPMTVNGDTTVASIANARDALSGWGNLFDPDPHDIKIN